MKITNQGLLTGARNAKGLTVIIDVFRAFSTSCYLIANGAEEIIPVGEVEKARSIKEENPDFLLIGERGGRALSEFQYNNSPSQLVGADFSDRTIILTTSSGTQGLVAARDADELITGSLVNLDSVVSYIKRKDPERVTIVPMGKGAKEPADEDELCARWIESKLKGNETKDTSSAIEALKEGDGKRFFEEENQGWSPESDFYLCTDLNRFNFVIKAYRSRDRGLVLRKV